jgi:malate dehydrogenase
MTNKKVAIIGAGAVGASAAFSLVVTSSCSEIILYDINQDAAIGKAIDLAQASQFSSFGTKVTAALEPSQIKDCDIVVITAGMPRKDGMTREDLLLINAKIMTEVVENIKTYSPEAKIICVSNPLDVMTYAVHKITGWERNRIVGMAGALDGARMSYQINKITGYDLSQTKSVVIGDHGENMIPATSMTSIGGISLDKLVSQEQMDQIIQRTKQGGAEIVKHLGTSAYYAPGRAVAFMVDSMLNDSKTVIASSCLLDGEYGYNDVCVGVPAVIGKNGVENIISVDLDDNLKEKFDTSVQTVQKGIDVLKTQGVFN